ncbi:MAG: hypothetical protein KGO83_00025 [Paenibacillaceae bacterium]|nr:hypothetical protein [Paenibacillaceae bacterium]
MELCTLLIDETRIDCATLLAQLRRHLDAVHCVPRFGHACIICEGEGIHHHTMTALCLAPHVHAAYAPELSIGFAQRCIRRLRSDIASYLRTERLLHVEGFIRFRAHRYRHLLRINTLIPASLRGER